ncbi:hypothetical protein JHS3_22170 [Jeongeupia sp. HS-3]|uniref:hypothetical protein n=1 Tax=Jeongeupia sp. HS-3 TaxID=1009682 RepID=UPI0018A4B65B|nr:hypothetical protein [Jeongeupia sp. HS-3]BCL76481.1 hypothetical protein JHS3_22170 [Jeongeupia sp. HS-3]
MWSSRFSYSSPVLAVAIFAASQAALAVEGGILISRDVAPRIAYRPDSPKSPNPVEVSASPARQTTDATRDVAGWSQADEALMGKLHAGQTGGQSFGGATAAWSSPAAAGGAGRMAGAGGASGVGRTISGATAGIAGQLGQALAPLTAR